jgi:hypothetical protein
MLTRVLRTVPLDRVDARSRAGVYLRRLRDALRQQLGHEPSAAETLLIDRACMSAVIRQAIDEHIVPDVEAITSKRPLIAQRDAMLENLVRLLARLGLKNRAKAEPETLLDYLREKDAASSS